MIFSEFNRMDLGQPDEMEQETQPKDNLKPLNIVVDKQESLKSPKNLPGAVIIPLNDLENDGSIKISTPASSKKRQSFLEPTSPSSVQTTPDISTPQSPGKRVPTRNKSDREVLVGTPVKEGHANYLLMYDMLTGIRISVSRCNAKNHRELVPEDFTAAHKLAFDV